MRELKPMVINQQASPWPTMLPHEALRSHFYTVAGQNYGDAIGEFREGENHWALDRGHMREIADRLAIRVLEDPAWIEQELGRIAVTQKELLAFTGKEIYRVDLKKKKNEQLLQLYQRSRQLFFSYYVHAWLPNAVEGPREVFARVLKDYLMEELNKKDRGAKIGEYFTTLTASPELTWEMREELSFYAVAVKIAGSKRAMALVKRKTLDLINLGEALRKSTPRVYRAVLEHVRSFEWLFYDYDAGTPTREDFLRRWRDLLRRGAKPANTLERLEKQRETLIEKQERYTNDIGLSLRGDYGYLFKVARRFTTLKDECHATVLQAFVHFEKLMDEIARRTGVDALLVHYVLPFEMRYFLLQKETRKEFVKELDVRWRYSVVVVTKNRVRIITGKPAEDFGSRVFRERAIAEDISEFKGDTGFPGKARGLVRIVETIHDIPKVKKGDIVVTPRANPNMMPAFRRASAVVSDTGGITSHAAILCRDLAIPCIVGTDIAAEVLQDGYRVEVDADEGIVTITKKK